MDEKQLQLLSKQLVTSKDDYMNSLRKNIDLYASQKDITIRAIAEEADISLNTLNSILYGNVKDCKLSTIISLARACVSCYSLFIIPNKNTASLLILI